MEIIFSLIFMSNFLCNGQFLSGVFESDPQPEDESISEMTNYSHTDIDEAFSEWTPESSQNAWELSGLYEGDILIADKEQNGLITEDFRWPNGTIPFYIKKQDFTVAQIDIIKSSMEELHKVTCIRFKPWTESDVNYFYIKGFEKGCYSHVGMNGRAQTKILNG